ncbi:MAG: hypothetical protein V4857_04420 [Pseudomonadota bacterium]
MKTIVAALLVPVALLTACKKETDPVPPQANTVVLATPAPEAAPAAAAAAPAAPAELTDEQKEMARKQGQLDYATMEDGYLKEPLGQWATGATATSTYSSNDPIKATGKIDGEYWQSNGGDVGFDSIELSFSKPVSATEVRAAFDQGDGIGGVTKVELQDTNGKWNVVWSGVSDVKHDDRGRRTWFNRTFPKTSYKAKGVKYTMMNTGGIKPEIDAVQLLGE